MLLLVSRVQLLGVARWIPWLAKAQPTPCLAPVQRPVLHCCPSMCHTSTFSHIKASAALPLQHTCLTAHQECATKEVLSGLHVSGGLRASCTNCRHMLPSQRLAAVRRGCLSAALPSSTAVPFKTFPSPPHGRASQACAGSRACIRAQPTRPWRTPTTAPAALALSLWFTGVLVLGQAPAGGSHQVRARIVAASSQPLVPSQVPG